MKNPGMPQAVLTFNFNESQSWHRASRNSKPVFLASQLVAGAVKVRYCDTESYRAGDTLHVRLVGNCRRSSWTAADLYNDIGALGSAEDELVTLERTFNIDATHQHQAVATQSHLVNFSFQACTKSVLDVKFGSPDSNDTDGFLMEDGAPQYSSSISLPSSAWVKFAHPSRGANRAVCKDNTCLTISVTYKLRASLWRGSANNVIAEADTELTILDDSHGSQPPTCISDFEPEFKLLQEATVSLNLAQAMARKLSQKRIAVPRLFVSAREPQPIVLRQSKEYSMTSVPIVLSLFNPGTEQSLQLPKKAIFTWKLQRRVFSSLKDLNKTPTIKSVRSKKHNILQKDDLDEARTYECQLSNWKDDNARNLFQSSHRPSFSCRRSGTDQQGSNRLSIHPQITKNSPCAADPADQISAPVSHERDSEDSVRPTMHVASSENPSPHTEQPTVSSIAHLPIAIPLSKLPLPTSFTPFIAIRYNLLITVSVRYDQDKDNIVEPRGTNLRSSKSWTMQADLTVPVQVLYEHETHTFPSLERSETALGHHTAADTTVLANEHGVAEVLPTYNASSKLSGVQFTVTSIPVG